MIPTYKFILKSTNGQTVQTRTVTPVYKDDIAIDWKIESNEQYYRGDFSGKLNFIGGDYTFIASKNIETEFELTIKISYDGTTYADYWVGRFWKTDCEIDTDNQKITVTPKVYDLYNDVVAGREKQYDLINLAPVIQNVKIDKRPMIQVYAPFASVVGCFLSGMYWEESAKEIENESDLVTVYHFTRAGGVRKCVVTDAVAPEMRGLYYGSLTEYNQPYSYTNGRYTIEYSYSSTPVLHVQTWRVKRNSGNIYTHEVTLYTPIQDSPQTDPLDLTLQPIAGSGATGTVKIETSTKRIYSRFVTDVDEIGGVATLEIPTDDIVDDNRNYHRCLGYNFGSQLYFTDRLSSTPTKYGIYQPNQYYIEPDIANIDFFPVAKSAWDEISVWLSFTGMDWQVEAQGRKQYTLRDAFPLWSVISVLLGQIAPDVTHAGTAAYSQFLYGSTNPLGGPRFIPMITPKSNILAGEYDQPAQKAPITLKQITDMLRDCFRCYWWIDTHNGVKRFRIEHISYFMKGGSYDVDPIVGVDLTAMQATRNGKTWAFATGKFAYDKLEMQERYEFGWMDDTTEIFNGFPINIVSRYVQAGEVENISIPNFTSDVDYMLLNPQECSEDGFALLGALEPQAAISPEGTLNAYVRTTGAFTPSGTNYTLTKYKVEANRVIKITAQITSVYRDTFAFASFYAGATPSGGQTFTVIKNFNGSESYVGYFTPPANGYIYIQTIADGTQQVANLSLEYTDTDSALYLPYATFNLAGSQTNHIVQNAYMSFFYLQQYYMYDMPAKRVSGDWVGAGEQDAQTKKQKTQDVKFPVAHDPNLYRLVKTNVGNGQIDKISINLASRNSKATLRYDTE